MARDDEQRDESRISRFIWTTHADIRLQQRQIQREEIVWVVKKRHAERAINKGRAQWRVVGMTDRGRRLVVIYDHPHGKDTRAARIVSAWPT